MTTYSGEVLGHHVSVSRELSLWDQGYLSESYKICEQALTQLPLEIQQEDFVKGMMTIFRGSINPLILMETYNRLRCKAN